MTCIAWDGKTLAADKRSSWGATPATTTKIERAPDGTLLGASGSTGRCRELRAWFKAGAKPETYPDKESEADLLAVSPEGVITLFVGTGYGVVVEDRHAAIGSARPLALLAMHLGRSAHDAVALASLFSTDCGNGVDSLELR